MRPREEREMSARRNVFIDVGERHPPFGVASGSYLLCPLEAVRPHTSVWSMESFLVVFFVPAAACASFVTPLFFPVRV